MVENKAADIVNPQDVNHLIQSHDLFAHIHRTYGPPPNWTRPQGFVSLSKIILEQQVSLASANAHFIKLNEYLPEFSPIEILKLSDAEMRSCQISRQKATYLRALSNAVLDEAIDLDQLAGMDLSEARDQLIRIKGIGNWTSDIYLMFCLGAKDIFPNGDIAVIHTIKELTNVSNKEEIIQLTEEWKPLRSLSTYFLWHYYLRKRGKDSKS